MCRAFPGLLRMLFLAFAFGAAAQAQMPPRLDRYGDPLPEGARVRLGTDRYQGNHAVSSVVFAPDGKLLASGNWDMAIRVWDTASYRERQRFFVGRGPDGKLRAPDKGIRPAVAFSPDSKTLAGSGADHVVYLWDAATGKERRRLGGKAGLIAGLAFAPDGKSLAGACADGSLRLWDVATGRELRALTGHAGKVLAVAFAADGKRLASGGADQTVRLWQVNSGKQLHLLKGHRAAVSAVLFVLQGKRLVSQDRASALLLWDTASGKELHQRKTFGAGYGLTRGPEDGSFITFAAARLESWDAATAHTTSTIYLDPQTYYGCGALAPDGKTLAAGSGFTSLRLLRYPSGQLQRTLRGSDPFVYTVAFAPDGKLLATGTGDNAVGRRGSWVGLWDVVAGKELRRLDGLDGGVFALAFSPDGRLLATADFDKTIRLWVPATGKERQRLRGHKEMVLRLAFSPDGKTLASAARDNTVRLWEVATGKERTSHRLGAEPAGGLAFAPNGKALAALSDRVSVWDFATGKGKSFPPRKGLVHLWYGDGRLLALLHEYKDGELLSLWDVVSGKKVREFLVGGTGRGKWTFAVSPDGRILATGRHYHVPMSRTMTIRLYELATGELRREFRGHEGEFIEDLAFSTDGRLLASGSGDATVLVWDVYGTPGRKPADAPGTEHLRRLWDALASSDSGPSFAAMEALLAAPPQTLSLLKKHLRPVPVLAAGRLAKLMAGLNDRKFAVRTKATAELEKLGEVIEAPLRRVLEDRSSLEVRRRVEQVLDHIDRRRGPQPSPAWLRQLRALEVLEHLCTPEARQLIEELAAGEPEAPLTRQACAVLVRLGRKRVAKP